MPPKARLMSGQQQPQKVSSPGGRSASSSPPSSSSARRRSSVGRRASSAKDPFSHISIVHSFVDVMNDDCHHRRFLVCLRDNLPFVGIERGCDMIADYSRRHILQHTREDHGFSLLKIVMWHAKRMIRGRRKLKALINEYAKRRRNEISELVRHWTRCEHETQRTVKVSFLEYAVCHVPMEEKHTIAAAVRIKYVHRWIRDMRDVRERWRLQSDHFFLWIAKVQQAISSFAYFGVKMMVLGTLPEKKYVPRLQLFSVQLRELVLEMARRRFGSNISESGLLRSLVVARTQKESLADPDLLSTGTYLSTFVVPEDVRAETCSSWSLVHPFFADPPDELSIPPPSVTPSSSKTPPQSNIALETGKKRSVSPTTAAVPTKVLSPAISAPPAAADHQATATSAATNNDTQQPSSAKSNKQRPHLVALSKTVISMVGNKWVEHPMFEGKIRYIPVAPPPDGTTTARGFNLDEACDRHRMKETNDDTSEASSHLGNWRAMVTRYEKSWEEIRRRPRLVASLRPASPLPFESTQPQDDPSSVIVVGKSSTAHSPKRMPEKRLKSAPPKQQCTTRSEMTPILLLSQPMSLSPRTSKPSPSHSRFYGSGSEPFPAMKQLGVFRIPTAPK